VLEHEGDPGHHEPVTAAFANSMSASLKAQDAIYDHAFMQLAEVPTVDHKMVLVVRKDLNMSVGKVAAQCSHAAIAIYKRLSTGNPKLLSDWEREGQKKVVVSCNSESELNELEKRAVSISLPCQTIRDAGRTEIAAGSKTVLVVLGPDYIVDQVTGTLHLLH
jgi:PTH2 family peptidyl-tRNA hydrolase